MKLNKKLLEWQAADLISQETASKIIEYEEKNKSPLFQYAITGIGALAIFLGWVSIVAANWQEISPAMKLIFDFLLGFFLCFSLAKRNIQEKSWVNEALITIICGWTIASIALIGQIYQLGGDGKSAITLWGVATMPLLLRGRSTLTGVILLGMMNFIVGIWMNYFHSDHLYSCIPALVLAQFSMSLSPSLRQRYPEIMKVFAFVSIATMLGVASMSSSFFYSSTLRQHPKLQYLFEALLILSPVLLWTRNQIKQQPKSLLLALISTVLCTFIPILPHPGGLDFLAMLFFILYWIIIAKAAHDLGYVGLFRIATFLVAGRMITIYFELVGTLLNTGLLFLTGGLLILFISRLWYKTQNKLIKREAETAPLKGKEDLDVKAQHEQDNLEQEVIDETTSENDSLEGEE